VERDCVAFFEAHTAQWRRPQSILTMLIGRWEKDLEAT
jgi:hypothetical protein